jgi:hypothetical protein
MKCKYHTQKLVQIIMTMFLLWHTTAWAQVSVFPTQPPGGTSSGGRPPAGKPTPTPTPPPPPSPTAIWDWTQDVTYRLYIAQADDVTVRLPYFDTMGPAAADLNLGAADVDISHF